MIKIKKPQLGKEKKFLNPIKDICENTALTSYLMMKD